MDELIQERGVIKRRMTSLKNHLNSFTTHPKKDMIHLKRRLRKAENFFVEFETVQQKIELMQQT